MSILKQIIVKKLENAEILSKSNKKVQSYQEFIQAYMICMCYINHNDKNIKKKISLWKKLITSNKNIIDATYRKILTFRKEEDEVIVKTLNKIETEFEDSNVHYQLYRPFTWGISADDYLINTSK